MKLWYSTTSPYVRKVMAVLGHHDLLDQVERVQITSSFDPTSPHNLDNPLGRVPALGTDEGQWLFNSSLIAEYLDAQGSAAKLFPAADDPQRWAILNLQSLADGIMENSLPVIAERLLRPESEWWHSRQQQMIERNRRSLAYLNRQVDAWAEQLNIGTLSVVCVVDWLVFRADKLSLQPAEVAPQLCRWAEAMNRRYPCLSESYPRLA